MRAEFDIIGRIGKIKSFDKTTRISVAANYSYKQDGKWIEDTHWNEVTIFNEKTRTYIGEHLDTGDLISVRGRIRSSSFDKDGTTHYTTDLIVSTLRLLADKSQETKPQPDNDGSD